MRTRGEFACLCKPDQCLGAPSSDGLQDKKRHKQAEQTHSSPPFIKPIKAYAPSVTISGGVRRRNITSQTSSLQLPFFTSSSLKVLSSAGQKTKSFPSFDTKLLRGNTWA